MAEVEAQSSVQELGELNGRDTSASPMPESAADPTLALATTITETGIVTTNSEGKRVKKIIRVKKRRPARPQVDPALFKSEPPPQTGE